MINDKNYYRQQVKQLSRLVSEEKLIQQDQIICQQLSNFLKMEYTNSLIMFYYPAKDEVKVSNLWPTWNQEFCLPAMENNQIVAKTVDKTSELVSSWGKVLEPKPSDPITDYSRIAVVVVPGRAFDIHCNRMGRGRAHYDNFLKKLNPSVYKIGLAYQHQLFDSLPVEDHDVAMNYVITAEYQYWR